MSYDLSKIREDASREWEEWRGNQYDLRQIRQFFEHVQIIDEPWRITKNHEESWRIAKNREESSTNPVGIDRNLYEKKIVVIRGKIPVSVTGP